MRIGKAKINAGLRLGNPTLIFGLCGSFFCACCPPSFLSPSWILQITLEKLRCGVRWTATKRVQFIARCKFVAKSEIGYFDIHFTVQQQILGLRKKKKNVKISLISKVINKNHFKLFNFGKLFSLIKLIKNYLNIKFQINFGKPKNNNN